MSIQIVTIKPRSIQDPVGCVEYQVLDEGNAILSHGHQVALPPETGPDTPLSLAQTLCENDAYRRNIVEAPEGWVDPNPPADPEPVEE